MTGPRFYPDDNPDALEDVKAPKDQLAEQQGQEYGDAYRPGELLTMPEPEAAKRVFKLWTDQDRLHQRRGAQWRANVLRRAGHVNVQVLKSQDYDRFYEWSWGPAVHHMNDAAKLCRKLVSNVWADPPAPQCVPASGDPQDIDAADFSTRVLEDLINESSLDDITTGRDAFDRACSYGSGFVHYYVNPQGRKAPVEIEAHPQAVHATQPFAAPQPVTQPDPATGQPMPVPDPATGQPMTQMVDQPPPYVPRFVAPDGALTDQKATAASQWLPTLKSEVLTGRNVRFCPPAADIWTADGVLLGGFKTFGELRKLFPEALAQYGPADVKKLQGYMPERPEDFLQGASRAERAAMLALDGDDAQVFCVTCYYTACPEYEKGANLIAVGGTVLLHRGPWTGTMEDGGEETLMLPLTQYAQFAEGRDDPYTVALMEILGPGNELRAAQLGSALEHLDRFNARKTFLPSNSPLSERDLDNPTRSTLRILPGQEPFYEEIPEYPEMGILMYDRVGADMDSQSGLEPAAQGETSPSVTSAKHAMTLVAQVHAGLSEIRQNTEKAAVRGYRIMLQLVRAYYTIPQKLKWDTPDGAHREKRWSRSDLGSTQDVRLKPATMTMLAPAVKIQYVQELGAAGILASDEVRDLLSSSLAATTGWKDEPHRLRIRRQIAEWEEGPPEGWVPPPPTVTGVDQMGQPIVGPGPDPASQAIWAPVPADQLPPVAQIRLLEIGKAMASTTYTRWPPEWRAGMDQAFQMAMMTVQAASAPPPPPAGSADAPGSDAAAEPPGLLGAQERP